MQEKYEEMTKEELIAECMKKDNCIDELMQRVREEKQMYSRDDIKAIYNCENAKALNILKFMFQTGNGIKVGREYYVTVKAHDEFLKIYKGKTVFI